MVQLYVSKYLDIKRLYFLPVRTRFGEFTSYSISLAGFRFMAKIDRRPFPIQFNPFILNGNKVFRGFIIEFEKTLEFHQAMEMVVRAERRRPS